MYKYFIYFGLISNFYTFAAVDTRSFPADNLSELRINSKSGNISITEAKTLNAIVKFEKVDFAKTCTLEMDKIENRIVIEIRDSGFVGNENCKINFEIVIPTEIALRINHGAGDIKVTGQFPDLNFNLGSGNTTIKYADAPKKGTVKINTGSGNATVYLPPNSVFMANLRAALGNLSNEVGQSERADFKISLHSGTGNLSIKKFE